MTGNLRDGHYSAKWYGSETICLGPGTNRSMPLNISQAQALKLTEDIRIGCWQLEYLPSLNFYVQRNVTHLSADKELVPFLRDTLPVYLFMSANDWNLLEPRLKDLCRVVGRHRDFYHHTEVVVVTNR